ncbi:MAG TPA: hypothetical protein VMU50_02645 [Polyangia bacterium]|nr:hypothetical protein [Polyangia bacterium]
MNIRRRARSRPLLAALVLSLPLALAAQARLAIAAAQLRALVVDDELRIRRGDRETALRAGNPLPPDGGTVTVQALRGETAAFQLIVFADGAGSEPAADTAAAATLSMEPFAASRTVAPAQAPAPAPRAAIFREHFVTVRTRSFNDHWPNESLGWTAGARPPDDAMLGDVPDALIPADLPGGAADDAARAGFAWHAFWIDVFVPETAPPGTFTARATSSVGGQVAARFSVRVDVQPAALPFRATSVFAFYEPERLQRRIGDGAAVERQLWQLLHAHHVDALPPLTSVAEVDRLADAFTGALFTAAHGYDGPGAGQPPQVLAVGTYGQLGDPSPVTLARARAIVDRLSALRPPIRADLFVYAIDETCRSPRAADWKKMLAGAPPLALPLAVGQTCDDPPEKQVVDVALMPAQAFTRAMPGAARAHGRRVWVYNGSLPRTGTLLLDAQPRGLLANGWIAALSGAGRWFYWESTFWDDDNRGGRGPIDPFANPVSFHNTDGDTALLDGVLVYPGRQTGAFAGAHSFGVSGVFPSVRLKMLRRGIEDAGYLMLAAREHPDEAARIALQALPAIADEAPVDRPPSWESAPAVGPRFAPARAALRALITRASTMTDADRDRVLDRLTAQRRATVPRALTRGQRSIRAGTVAGTVALLLLLAAAVARRRATRRRARSLA